MFSMTDANRFFLYPHPTDIRKNFYMLSGIVTNQMGLDLQDIGMFIFINMPCTSMKVLHLECVSSNFIPADFKKKHNQQVSEIENRQLSETLVFHSAKIDTSSLVSHRISPSSNKAYSSRK